MSEVPLYGGKKGDGIMEALVPPLLEANETLLAVVRCRANLANVRESRPDPGLELSHFQAFFLNIIYVFPFSLGSGLTIANKFSGLSTVGCPHLLAAHSQQMRNPPRSHNHFKHFRLKIADARTIKSAVWAAVARMWHREDSQPTHLTSNAFLE